MCVRDGSHSDRRERSKPGGVEQDVELAEAFDATVHFLYVVDAGTEMSPSAVGNITDELSEALDKMVTDALDSATTRAEDEGIPYERTIT